ncbi:UNVERIFIED_ORG: chorismate mutase/prephenate dehydratase [Variovorax paradoxus]|nr:chorismate mutase/prephenate dehydratase [Variovorax paradoxus]
MRVTQQKVCRSNGGGALATFHELHLAKVLLETRACETLSAAEGHQPGLHPPSNFQPVTMPKLRAVNAVACGLLVVGNSLNLAVAGPIGYLGPAGSWTHQACLDLFGGRDLVPLARDQLFRSYADRKVERACVPVTTSVVGVTPYLDAVLDLPEVTIVAEYPKMLGYSLLAKPGTKREDIVSVHAHPVAFEEVKPWLEQEMPQVRRVEAASGGAAAQAVARSSALDAASFGPRVGADIYQLVSLVDGIEEGPHNVTRWWVLGRQMPAPTGHDKTSLLVNASDASLSGILATFSEAGVQVLTIYERPSKKSLDTHRYLVEVAGHAKQGALEVFLEAHRELRVLGSYPRR